MNSYSEEEQGELKRTIDAANHMLVRLPAGGMSFETNHENAVHKHL